MRINGNLQVETISGSSTQGNIVVYNSVTKEIESRTTLNQSSISGLTTDLANKQPLDATLTALAGYNTNGLMVQTSADTFVGRSLTQPPQGIAISNNNGVLGNPTFALTNDLSALEALSSTGFAVRTGTDAWTQRTISGTSGQIIITNGNGVSGNPVISIDPSITGSTPIFSGGTGLNSIISLPGTDAVASGTGSISIGSGAQSLSTQAISFGVASSASGTNATAIGATANANGDNSVVVGTSVASSNASVAIGFNCTSNTNGSITIGSTNSVTGQTSIAIGEVMNVNGVNGIGIGSSNSVTGQTSICIGAGNGTNAVGAKTLGINNRATGLYSYAVGYGADASRYGEFAYQIDPTAVVKSQYGFVQYYATTTNATSTEIFLANVSPNRFSIAIGEAYFIRTMAIARHTGTGAIKTWTATASIKNQGGTTTLVQSALTLLGNEATLAAATWAQTGNNTNDAYQIAVTGVAGLTINWTFQVEYVRV